MHSSTHILFTDNITKHIVVSAALFQQYLVELLMTLEVNIRCAISIS